jgi:tetratricopeptide (TPR) repeat protein
VTGTRDTPVRTAALTGLVVAALSGAAVSQAAAPPPEVRQCLGQRLHGQESAAQKCFMALTHASSPYLRAEGAWGLSDYDAANSEFRAAVAQADGNALYRTRWGELLHERFNNVDAAGLFKEALLRDPGDAQALLGLARVSADGFDDQAVARAQQALAAATRTASPTIARPSRCTRSAAVVGAFGAGHQPDAAGPGR